MEVSLLENDLNNYHHVVKACFYWSQSLIIALLRQVVHNEYLHANLQNSAIEINFSSFDDDSWALRFLFFTLTWSSRIDKGILKGRPFEIIIKGVWDLTLKQPANERSINNGLIFLNICTSKYQLLKQSKPTFICVLWYQRWLYLF